MGTLASLLLAVLCNQAIAAVVAISGNELTALAEDTATGGDDIATFTGTSTTASGSITASSGLSSNTTDYDWNELPGGQTFGFTMDHKAAAGYLSYAETYNFGLFFTPNEGLYYTLSGNYAATGDATTYLYAYLYDVADDSFLFFNEQQSFETNNQAFILGETDGDDYNFLSGSLTGSLEEGRDYEFALWAYIYQETDPGTEPASARGAIDLVISDIPPVPIPAAGWLFISALAGLGVLKRSR